MDYEAALEVFGLDSLQKTTFNDFRTLYKTLAKTRHPDTKDGSEKDFVELREAYALLSEYGEFAEEELNPNALKIVRPSKNALKALTKEDIIKRYYKDTLKLTNQIEVYRGYVAKQESVINKIKQKVQKITADFGTEKTLLKKELRKEIKALDKKYAPNLWNKIFFFLPSKSEREYWDRYNRQLDEYSARYAELNLSFFKLILSCYGDGLNRISHQKHPVPEELDEA